MTNVVDTTGHERVTQSIPRGLIVAFTGSAIPAGWYLCDGNNGTPDLRFRFIVGDDAVTDGGVQLGTVNATAALTHAGAAVGAHAAHVVTQSGAHTTHTVGQGNNHTDHSVTQPGAHSNHAANATHTHDNHTTSTSTASTTQVMTGPTTHAANATHTHDAHTAHAGADLDIHSTHLNADLSAHAAHANAALDAHSAHSVTQPSNHAIPKTYTLAYIMWSGGIDL